MTFDFFGLLGVSLVDINTLQMICPKYAYFLCYGLLLN